MNSIVHFELPAEDRERMSKFYTEVFGWKTNMLGEDMGNYVLVETTEIDEKTKRPLKPGAINGGFFEKGKDNPLKHPSLTIAVDDLNKAMENVKKAGGKIVGKPVEIKGYGMYVVFNDSEGNSLSMMEPSEMPEEEK